jgi:uncharacterized protein YlaN (UPF0358 family)
LGLIKIDFVKKKNLKGLPGNLANSYLSTHSYYHKGYSGDWILYLSNKNGIEKTEINLLTGEITPSCMIHDSLKNDIEKMKQIIQVQLKNNGFKDDFIIEAVLKFKISTDLSKTNNTVVCESYIKLKDGTIYKPKYPTIEIAYPLNS